MAMKMKAMKAVVEEEVPRKAVRKMKAKKAAAKPKKAAARKWVVLSIVGVHFAWDQLWICQA